MPGGTHLPLLPRRSRRKLTLYRDFCNQSISIKGLQQTHVGVQSTIRQSRSNKTSCLEVQHPLQKIPTDHPEMYPQKSSSSAEASKRPKNLILNFSIQDQCLRNSRMPPLTPKQKSSTPKNGNVREKATKTEITPFTRKSRQCHSSKVKIPSNF